MALTFLLFAAFAPTSTGKEGKGELAWWIGPTIGWSSVGLELCALAVLQGLLVEPDEGSRVKSRVVTQRVML